MQSEGRSLCDATSGWLRREVVRRRRHGDGRRTCVVYIKRWPLLALHSTRRRGDRRRDGVVHDEMVRGERGCDCLVHGKEMAVLGRYVDDEPTIL
jgi:hypothetical protein